MENWKQIKLKDVCNVKGGKRLPIGEDFSNSGYPYIRARDIKNGKINIETPVFITEKIREKIKKYITNTNDILITIVGANIGDVGIVPKYLDGSNLTENAVKLTDYKDIIPQFLVKYLISNYCREIMQQSAAGAAQGKLGIYKINEMYILLPKIEIQKKIASILSAYDDLIENNNKRIAILEKMAEELYREWFVRLRFPEHEKTKIVKGIPEGWEYSIISSIFETKNGKTVELNENGIYIVYGSNGIIGKSNKFNFENCLIIGRVGAYCGSVNITTKKIWATDNTIIAFPKNNRICLILSKFIFESLNLRNFAGGSAQPLLTQDLICKIKIRVPSNLFNKVFEKKISPMFQKIEILKNKNTILKISREKLLSRLMSGKIDVENLDIHFPPSMKEE